MKAEKYRVAPVVSRKYRVTALNVTRIWIKLAGRLAMGGRAKFLPNDMKPFQQVILRYQCRTFCS